MTKDQLNKWLAESKLMEWETTQDNCNQWGAKIYRHGEKYYLVEFCNDIPAPVFREKGYEHGSYEPIEVFRKEKIVRSKVIQYCFDDGEDCITPQYEEIGEDGP